jgi:nicotinamidase-related amidase
VPITALDPRTALIVIDLQVGTLAAQLAHPVEDVTGHAAELLAAFRERGLPVVLASVDGMPGGRTQYGEGARAFPAEFSSLVPELEQRASDTTIIRRTWSAFAGSNLDAQLRVLGVTQVVLAGVATSFGVESTARSAYDLGYSVAVASDAITDRSIEAHDASVERVFPVLGQVGTSAEIVSMLGS